MKKPKLRKKGNPSQKRNHFLITWLQLKAAAVNKEVVLALVGVFQHRRPDLKA